MKKRPRNQEPRYRLATFSSAHDRQILDIHRRFAETSFAEYAAVAADESFLRYIRLVMGLGYPARVVLRGASTVVGYGYMQPYSHLDTLERAARVSLYVLPEHCGQGLGGRMLDGFEQDMRRMGKTTVIADLSSKNEQSRAFFLKKGYAEVGRFKAVGRKFGEDFDILWMQKLLDFQETT